MRGREREREIGREREREGERGREVTYLTLMFIHTIICTRLNYSTPNK